MGSGWTREISHKSRTWKARVFDRSGKLVARLSGTEHYVNTLTDAMLARGSVDVGDLLAGPSKAHEAPPPHRPQSSTRLRALGNAGSADRPRR